MSTLRGQHGHRRVTGATTSGGAVGSGMSGAGIVL